MGKMTCSASANEAEQYKLNSGDFDIDKPIQLMSLFRSNKKVKLFHCKRRNLQ